MTELNLALVGFSHKTAPLAVRETLALLPAPKVLEAFRSEGIAEAVAMSTCNRFEVYAAGETARCLEILEKLAQRSLKDHSYFQSGSQAIRHLFAVSAGLDSLVVGETEILGQVKNAYEASQSLGMTAKTFNVLFQRALYVGKKVRSDTGIAVGQTSVASVAVQLAETIFGEIKRCEVLILGAGAMAETTARHLMTKKIARLTIANRTRERALELAERVKAQTLEWENFAQALERVDIVVSSTGSPLPVLTRDMLEPVLRRRAGRSLFIIDIAMPRDVEESVHALEHVYVYRLEDLESIVAENLKSRVAEVELAKGIVAKKAAEFSAWADSVSSGREISMKHSPANAP